MNVFNRIVVILLIILGFALAVTLVTFQWDVIATALRARLDGFTTALYNDRIWLTFLGAVAAWAVLMVLLFVLEVRHPRRKVVRIRTASGGKARLGIDSVLQSLQYRIDELPGVRQVQPRIVSRGKDVEVTIDLDTSPSVNVPTLTDQVISLSRDVVEGQLGVKIRGNVGVNVRHEPYPSGAKPSVSGAADADAAKPAGAERRVPPLPTPTPYPGTMPGLAGAPTRATGDVRASESTPTTPSR